MTRVRSWFATRRGGYDGHAAVLLQIAREVVERRRSMPGALNEVKHPAVLDNLADEDFRTVDSVIADNVADHREYAIALARLAHAAARAKGFDRQIVDAAIRLDSLLPLDDESRERDQLLRDAYMVAQKTGYIRGGRVTLARLGQRALDNDDLERARKMFSQQLDIGDELTDGVPEIESAVALGDILRREGDALGAQALYRRAGRSANRLDHHRGIAAALVRQIELADPGTGLETIAALQRQALDAVQRTPDLALQAKILLQLAETLTRMGKVDEVPPLLERGVQIAAEIGDLSLESRCRAALVEADERLGRRDGAARNLGDLLDLEDRLGNRAAAAALALRLGLRELEARRPDEAADAFDRARELAAAVRDSKAEQRALGGLAAAFTELRAPAEAVEALQRALDLARRDHDVPAEAQWLASLGQTLWRARRRAEANRAINEALALARRVDDHALQADLQATLGDMYLADGQAPRARESYTRAHDLHRRVGNVPEQIRLLVNLGRLAADGRQTGQATALFDQALRLAEESGNRLAAARLHGRLGKLAQGQRDAAGALDHFRQAAHIAEGLDDEALVAQAVLSLAAAQHAVNDPGAQATYQRALALARQQGQPAKEALIHYNLGLLLSASGRTSEALNSLYSAADLVTEHNLPDPALAERVADAIDALGGATLEDPRDLRDDGYGDLVGHGDGGRRNGSGERRGAWDDDLDIARDYDPVDLRDRSAERDRSTERDRSADDRGAIDGCPAYDRPGTFARADDRAHDRRPYSDRLGDFGGDRSERSPDGYPDAPTSWSDDLPLDDELLTERPLPPQ